MSEEDKRPDTIADRLRWTADYLDQIDKLSDLVTVEYSDPDKPDVKLADLLYTGLDDREEVQKDLRRDADHLDVMTPRTEPIEGVSDEERAKHAAARQALYDWFYREHVEHLDLNTVTDDDYDIIEGHYEDLMATFCRYAGHEVMDDQCGRPEHRFCFYCQTRQPNAEVTI